MKVRTQTLQSVAEFAARFGFITRDLYFRYFSPYRHTQSFKSWRLFFEEGWLLAYDSGRLAGYLSRKARQRLVASAVPARNKNQIPHDLQAAEFLLELERRNVVIRYWTEPELSGLPAEIFAILGTNISNKVPDLVMELAGSQNSIRVALEIERTVKSKERYAAAALSYLGMKNIDLVMFGCRFTGSSRQIEQAFKGKVFTERKKIPGVFSTMDFFANRFHSLVKYQDREFKMHDFFEKALLRDITPDIPASAYTERTAIRMCTQSEAKSA